MGASDPAPGTLSRGPTFLQSPLVALVLATTLVAVIVVGTLSTAPAGLVTVRLPIALGDAAGSSTPSTNSLFHPASPAAPPTGIAWRSASPPTAFEPRRGVAVAAEANGSLSLIFGGQEGGTVLNDSWVYWYANDSFHEVALDRGPAPRHDASMAWDAAQGTFLLFGGQDGALIYNDTWSFDPTTFAWTEVCSSGGTGAHPGCAPAQRYGAALIGGSGGTVLLYGGQGYPPYPYSDTWTFQAGSWTNITSTAGSAPGAVEWACGASVSAGAVLFGGNLGTGSPVNATSIFNWTSKSWSSLHLPEAPTARDHCGLAEAAGGSEVVLLGGLNGSAYDADAWSLSSSSWTWTPLGNTSLGDWSDGGLAPTGPSDAGVLAVGGTAPGALDATARVEIGGLLPSVGPRVVTENIGLVQVGTPWAAWANVSTTGTFAIVGVSILFTPPGSSTPVEASLAFEGGTNLSGSWSGLLPALASPGSLAWSVVATDSGGGTSVTPGPIGTVRPAPALLTGTVDENALSGNRSALFPLEGAWVNATGFGPGNVSSALSSATGSYALSVPAGSYQVTVAAPGVPTSLTRAVNMTWAPLVESFVLTVRLPAPVLGQVSELKITGAYTQNIFFSGATVEAVGLGTGNLTSTLTNSHGNYSLALPAGTYTLEVDWENLSFAQSRIVTTNWSVLIEDFTYVLNTQAPPDVQGIISIAGQNGERLPGVLVNFTSSVGERLTTVSDQAGAFNATLGTGTWTASFNDTFYQDRSLSFDETGRLVWLNVSLNATNPNRVLVVALTLSTTSPSPSSSMTVNVSVSNERGAEVSSAYVVASIGNVAGTFFQSVTPTYGLPVHGSIDLGFLAPGVTGSFVIRAEVNTSFTNVSRILNFTVGVSAPAPGPGSQLPVYAAIGGLLAFIAVLAFLVARKINPSRVEEIFLIYRGGKLVWHASRTARADLEPEVVTGMLEAVEGFVEKSFSPEGGQLNVLDFADMKLHIVRGQKLVAAALVSGRNPGETVREVEVALADMEKAWAEPLKEWDGTPASLPHLRGFVDALLNGYYRYHTRWKPAGGDAKPGSE